MLGYKYLQKYYILLIQEIGKIYLRLMNL